MTIDIPTIFKELREWSGLAGFLLALILAVIKLRSSSFFITLHLEYNGPPNVLTPEQSHGHFQRKYLRIYLHNRGHAVATGCTAQLHILEAGDLKRLCWDGIDVLSDRSNTRKIGVERREILHIIFSDPRSTTNYGYISTMLSITNLSILRLED